MAAPKEKPIRVLYPSGQEAYRATVEDARRLVRLRFGEGLGTGQKLRAVQLFDGPSRVSGGTKYTHTYATKTNPPGVVELRELKGTDKSGEKVWLPRSLFCAVQTSVLSARPA